MKSIYKMSREIYRSDIWLRLNLWGCFAGLFVTLVYKHDDTEFWCNFACWEIQCIGIIGSTIRFLRRRRYFRAFDRDREQLDYWLNECLRLTTDEAAIQSAWMDGNRLDPSRAVEVQMQRKDAFRRMNREYEAFRAKYSEFFSNTPK